MLALVLDSDQGYRCRGACRERTLLSVLALEACRDRQFGTGEGVPGGSLPFEQRRGSMCNPTPDASGCSRSRPGGSAR